LIVALFYLAVLITSITLGAQFDESSWTELPMILIAGLGGTIHASLIRSTVFAPGAVRPVKHLRPRRQALHRSVDPGVVPTIQHVLPPVVPMPPPPTPAPRPRSDADQHAARFETQPPQPQPPKRGRQRQQKKLPRSVEVFLQVIAGVGYFFYAKHKGLLDTAPSKSTAIRACEHFVGDELKAPSTADYAAKSEDDVFQHATRYTVIGYVDADNSFGAKLRLNYTCTVQWHSTKREWGLIHLTGLS
jgi:hypothetical protein